MKAPEITQPIIYGNETPNGLKWGVTFPYGWGDTGAVFDDYDAARALAFGDGPKSKSRGHAGLLGAGHAIVKEVQIEEARDSAYHRGWVDGAKMACEALGVNIIHIEV